MHCLPRSDVWPSAVFALSRSDCFFFFFYSLSMPLRSHLLTMFENTYSSTVGV